MKKSLQKNLSKVVIDSWPIVAAISYGKNLGPQKYEKLTESSSFRNQLELYSNGSLLEEFCATADNLEILTLKDVEGIFESSLAEDVRKLQGAVYTPEFIIDFIIEKTITDSNIPTYIHPLLDPACGSGGFLVRAGKYLSERFGGTFTSWTAALCGIDINPKAIANARLLLDLACLTEDGELSETRFIVGDSLLIELEQQFRMLGIENGVSVLVTNPPYVKLQNLESEYAAELIGKYANVASGAFSLASLFLHNSTKYLLPEGLAGMITLNNIFTSLSGRNLRIEWSQQKSVWKIIDFRHFAVFDASAYSCLIFLNSQQNEELQYNAVREMPTSSTLRRLEPTQISYQYLKPEKWRLGDQTSLRLIDAMEVRGTPLKAIAEIKVGFATLRDKVFMGMFIDGSPTFIGGDGISRVVEKEAVHDFLKVSELNDFTNVSSLRRPIIYPYDRSKSSRPLVGLADFAEKYPITFEHLASWKGVLQSRGFSESEDWHQWGRRQSLTSDGPKLLTKTFDVKPNFRLDVTDSLFSNGYSVKPKEVFDSYGIKELQRFLQSRFVHAYTLVTSFEISGGYQCYQKNFIENICVPPKELLIRHEDNHDLFEKEMCKFYGIEFTELETIMLHYGSQSLNAST